MILLTDVATKLQEILNSYFLSDFEFVVKSAGYHLDSIVDKQTSRNTIPVFVSQVGGEYNPVPNLHQINTTYEITLYYPVRFKDTFYSLNGFLENTFVGKKLIFGTENALCNIGVAEYGEIIEVEALRRFENWIAEEFEGSVHLFKKEQQVNEFYMSMQFRLFTTTLGDGFMFGNDVKYELTATMPFPIKRIIIQTATNISKNFIQYPSGNVGGKYCWIYLVLVGSITIYTDESSIDAINKNTKFYSYNSETETFIEKTTYKFLYFDYGYGSTANTTLTEQLVWDSSGTGASISPISEQLIGVDKYARNTPNITNFNKSIVVYVKNNQFWRTFLYCYNSQKLDLITNVKLVKTYNFGDDIQAIETYNQILLSYNENVELGSPLSFTLTFGD